MLYPDQIEFEGWAAAETERERANALHEFVGEEERGRGAHDFGFGNVGPESMASKMLNEHREWITPFLSIGQAMTTCLNF